MSQTEREARRERLAALRAAGVDPYPARVGPREPISALRARCEAHDESALETAQIRGAVLDRVDLRGACLRGADLSDSSLTEADIREGTLAKYNRRDLEQVTFDEMSSQLVCVVAARADLSNAKLSNAFVIQSDFTDAILNNCALRKADLRNSIFTGAVMRGVDLSGEQETKTKKALEYFSEQLQAEA